MLLVALTFTISLLASVLSGIGGGGGGFILTPYLILIGLSPQQAVATGKLSGLGVAFGSLSAFRGKHLIDRRILLPLVSIVIVTSLLAAWVLPKLNEVAFQKTIGILLLVLIPTLFINRGIFRPGARSGETLWWGYLLYAGIAFMQAMVGTGLAMMLTMDLMFLFGLTALHANATQRVTQVVQAAIMFVLLTMQGLVVFKLGLAGLAGCVVGAYIGGRIAVEKGSHFVKIILAVTMLISGIALLVTK